MQLEEPEWQGKQIPWDRDELSWWQVDLSPPPSLSEREYKLEHRRARHDRATRWKYHKHRVDRIEQNLPMQREQEALLLREQGWKAEERAKVEARAGRAHDFSEEERIREEEARRRKQEESASVIQGAARGHGNRATFNSRVEHEKGLAAEVVQGALQGKSCRRRQKRFKEQHVKAEEQRQARQRAKPLTRSPDRSKIRAVVDALDVDVDGEVSVNEVRILLGKLLGIPAEEVPADHPEVQAFAGMSCEAMIETLCETITPEQCEEYYRSVFPSGQEGQEGETCRAEGIQGAVRGCLDRERVRGMHHHEERMRHQKEKKEKLGRKRAQLENLQQKLNPVKQPHDRPRDVEDAAASSEEGTSSQGSIQDPSWEEAGASLSPDIDAHMSRVVPWLYRLLAGSGEGIPINRLVTACKFYDKALPTEGILETFASVGVDPSAAEEAVGQGFARGRGLPRAHVSHEQLGEWVRMMFGDCDGEEFISGVYEFGKAAEAAGRVYQAFPGGCAGSSAAAVAR